MMNLNSNQINHLLYIQLEWKIQLCPACIKQPGLIFFLLLETPANDSPINIL